MTRLRHLSRLLALGLLITVSVAGIVFVEDSRQIHACSCGRIPQAPESADLASSVFLGEVTAVSEPGRNRGGGIARSGDRITVEFKVEESWKGRVYRKMFVGTEHARCGYAFQVGRRYLVYAVGAPDSLAVHLCSGTDLESRAADDLAALGEGSAPEPGRNVVPRPTNASGSCTAAPSSADVAAAFWPLILIFPAGRFRRRENSPR